MERGPLFLDQMRKAVEDQCEQADHAADKTHRKPLSHTPCPQAMAVKHHAADKNRKARGARAGSGSSCFLVFYRNSQAACRLERCPEPASASVSSLKDAQIAAPQVKPRSPNKAATAIIFVTLLPSFFVMKRAGFIPPSLQSPWALPSRTSVDGDSRFPP